VVARMASICATASLMPPSVPSAGTSSSAVGANLANDRHRCLLGRLYESDLYGRGRRVSVRRSVVSVAFLESERARRIDRGDPPPRVELLAVGTRHGVGDTAARPQIVVDDGGGVGRRSPPSF
jgi:hypothetical protein